MDFKKELKQYRYIKSELKMGSAVDPEGSRERLRTIENKVAGIEDARVRQALFMRYLSQEKYSWERVADIVHYSEGHIRMLVRDALKEIE